MKKVIREFIRESLANRVILRESNTKGFTTSVFHVADARAFFDSFAPGSERAANWIRYPSDSDSWTYFLRQLAAAAAIDQDTTDKQGYKNETDFPIVTLAYLYSISSAEPMGVVQWWKELFSESRLRQNLPLLAEASLVRTLITSVAEDQLDNVARKIFDTVETKIRADIAVLVRDLIERAVVNNVDDAIRFIKNDVAIEIVKGQGTKSIRKFLRNEIADNIIFQLDRGLARQIGLGEGGEYSVKQIGNAIFEARRAGYGNALLDRVYDTLVDPVKKKIDDTIANPESIRGLMSSNLATKISRAGPTASKFMASQLVAGPGKLRAIFSGRNVARLGAAGLASTAAGAVGAGLTSAALSYGGSRYPDIGGAENYAYTLKGDELRAFLPEAQAAAGELASQLPTGLAGAPARYVKPVGEALRRIAAGDIDAAVAYFSSISI